MGLIRNNRVAAPLSLIRFLRMWFGMTQSELAEKLGWFKCDVVNIEKNTEMGKRMIFGRYVELSRFFGIPADMLYNDDFRGALSCLTHPLVPFPCVNPLVKESSGIGQAGEDYVAEQERRKLEGTPFGAFVNTNYANDVMAGFDIFSFDLDGTPIFIEVKSTSHDLPHRFNMSHREYQFIQLCRENGWRYEIHRVYNMADGAEPQCAMYTLDDLTDDHFFVTDYRVNMRASA